MLRILRLFVVIGIAIICLDSLAYAQNGGMGGDMWTRRMEQDGLFTLHHDFCSSTESFISVAADGKGFCMDEDQRTADTFEDARQDCFDEGKRLPEPVEFQHACRYGTGLNDMTDDWEWTSNFVIPYRWVSFNLDILIVPVMGYNNCQNAEKGIVASSYTGGYNESIEYRCVR